MIFLVAYLGLIFNSMVYSGLIFYTYFIELMEQYFSNLLLKFDYTILFRSMAQRTPAATHVSSLVTQNIKQEMER